MAQAVTNQDIIQEDRETLAAEYEKGDYTKINAGAYPTYADLALNGNGAFTLCSLRAIAATRIKYSNKE